jgi:hypothetical protein
MRSKIATISVKTQWAHHHFHQKFDTPCPGIWWKVCKHQLQSVNHTHIHLHLQCICFFPYHSHWVCLPSYFPFKSSLSTWKKTHLKNQNLAAEKRNDELVFWASNEKERERERGFDSLEINDGTHIKILSHSFFIPWKQRSLWFEDREKVSLWIELRIRSSRSDDRHHTSQMMLKKSHTRITFFSDVH